MIEKPSNRLPKPNPLIKNVNLIFANLNKKDGLISAERIALVQLKAEIEVRLHPNFKK
jgi:hypothetical protein